MAQSLLIGLGGTGSRVVNNVVKELRRNGKSFNDGKICCAVLDTNVNDNELIDRSGTGVPVFPTSKPQKIRGYFEQYNHLHMETWCPQSPSFMEQSIIDGASEMRVKSRIAFMDCIESGTMRSLEMMINNVLKNNSNSKIRIMIVSSLSGGTGSGMFIQVALWLRKLFAKTSSEITIRGIFLLPDVFVSTIDNIRNDNTRKVRNYCNAYAAIRELNAVTKIMKGDPIDIPEKIEIGKLFDSDRDGDCGVPLYDYAFFVDNQDLNGVQLESISDYEEMVAQLVYMQLYAPMASDMYSQEDNDFLGFNDSPEPLYGSCGTAKAEYPRDSVKNYCAFRAAQDSLKDSWKSIDNEIDALKREEEQLKEEGIIPNEEIDDRVRFMDIFEQRTSVNTKETGKDRFFISIANDIKRQEKSVKDGHTKVNYIDKIPDFIKQVNQRIDTVAMQKKGTEKFSIPVDAFVAQDHTKQELKDRIKMDERGLAQVIEDFENNVETYANGIVSYVFPYSMGGVKATNRGSIYELLSKPRDKGGVDFVHPLAARYLLYKLLESLKLGLKNLAVNDAKNKALSGGDVEDRFDNPRTAVHEDSPEAFLDNLPKGRKENASLDDFERRYAEFIEVKIALCEKFEKNCLKERVYQSLLDRVEELIKKLEDFFVSLNDVQKKLQSDLEKNSSKTDGIVGKTKYVFGDEKAKEYIYQSLNLGLGNSSEIYKNVVDSIYGGLCAEKRPGDENNKVYAHKDISEAFLFGIVKMYKGRINNDKRNSKLVNLDIYTAVCKESDMHAEKEGIESKNRKLDEGISFEESLGELDNIDLENNTVTKVNQEEIRHNKAFIDLKNELYRMAAPFLYSTNEVPADKMGRTTSNTKTFWGYSPELKDVHSSIGSDLGGHEDLQVDEAYPKNELYCYRAKYGMMAKYIPKFDDVNDGEYYANYSLVVDEMVRNSAGKAGERALVSTPHLDKNWHRILPYITAEKQQKDKSSFYHGLWLATAYGHISTDKDGVVYIKRRIYSGFGGGYIEQDEPIKYGNKKVTKTDVARLIEVLKKDKVFTDTDIPELEDRFEKELAEIVTYVDTGVMKGLTVKKEDLNPINVITRYNGSRNHDKSVTAAMVIALENIAGELAKAYNLDRDKDELEKPKYSICKMIYKSSPRVKGRSEIFGTWEKKFEEYGIKEEASGSSK